jgi:NADPH-dependent curcumin reductase CurA
MVREGLVGRTAFHAIATQLNVQPGDTVLVSGATGGVGHIAVQIAKLLGATVYGVTSTEEKAEWLRTVGVLPIVVKRNSNLEDMREAFSAVIDRPIDKYLENVGNDYFVSAIRHMSMDSIMCYCGCMKHYNATLPQPGPNIQALIYKDIVINGALKVLDSVDKMYEFYAEHGDQVVQLETIYEGLDKIPEQFVEHFTDTDGARSGKSLCKL